MKRFLLIAAFALCCTEVLAKTLYVSAGGYTSIQSAIGDANDGDTVVVSPGTYPENIDFLGKSITVRSVEPDDPNMVAATIIDGSNPSDSNYGSAVTFKNGEDNSSVLTGFTITGGTGSWLLVSWEFKGLRWNRCGGGVVCYNMSAPTICKNVFISNIAGQGGGIYIYGDPVNPDDPSNPVSHISPVITDNIFLDNSAIVEHGFAPPDANYPNNDHGDGGAIVGFQGCNARITGNLIENNNADFYGGGIHLRQWSNGVIEDNQIIGNDSKLGAGIHVTYSSSPTVRNNLIESNEAGSLGGGGIYVYYLSNPLIERNIIRHNISSRGAGVAVMWDSKPVISTNLVTDNFDGAGILCVDSSPHIIHNTIVNNTARAYSGGIHCEYGASPLIEHNIVSSNGNGYGIYVSTASEPTTHFNDVWNHPMGDYGPDISDQTGVNGNISAAPKFVAPDCNDYHLSYDSKCINAGEPNFTDPGRPDFDGQPRVMGQFIDIGADEARPVWNVTSDAQYEKIQQAIDGANNLDMIIVTEGRYFENIDFKGKAITLTSLDPNDWNVVEKTIVDGNNNADNQGTVVTFTSGEDANSILAGFTITGGYRDMDDPQGGFGGGIKCHEYSSPTILRNIIKGNCGWKGAGMSLYHSSSLVRDNIFVNNKSTKYGYGGGMSIIDSEAPTIVNNLIVGNDADIAAGGIMLIHSDAIITNNTIAFNRTKSGGPAGIYIESFDDIIANCIIWGNGDDLWQTIGASEVRFSCIEDGDVGEGNISDYPNFTDPGYWDDAGTPADLDDDFFVYGNYHIAPNSPCINAGDNNSLPPLLDTDADAEERIFQGIVDIGADEAVTNPADLNNDGIVDYLELAVLAAEWLQSGSELQSDLYDDDFIDFADFSILAAEWLWEGGWYK